MVYDYKECLNMYGSHYGLKLALSSGSVYKIKKGLYSTDKHPKELEIFVKEHKAAVFTLQSAFYYLGISDVIPTQYVVATDKDATKYKGQDIKQYYINNGLVNIGAITINYSGVEIPIYSKERMLIEALRYKKSLPFDYYKEIINYYRNHIDDIDITLVLDYLESFPKKNLLTKAIQLEVL